VHMIAQWPPLTLHLLYYVLQTIFADYDTIVTNWACPKGWIMVFELSYQCNLL
jgi:hypothetical protein